MSKWMQNSTADRFQNLFRLSLSAVSQVRGAGHGGRLHRDQWVTFVICMQLRKLAIYVTVPVPVPTHSLALSTTSLCAQPRLCAATMSPGMHLATRLSSEGMRGEGRPAKGDGPTSPPLHKPSPPVRPITAAGSPLPDYSYNAQQSGLTWMPSSSAIGSHSHRGAFTRESVSRRRRSDLEINMSNSALRVGDKSSHLFGTFTGFSPPKIPRPSSDVTIMMRNPAIRDVPEGGASSDVYGNHTGTLVDRRSRLRPRTTQSAISRGDPEGGALWQRGQRTSEAIGTHPKTAPLDFSNRAAVQYEASYARSFPSPPIANRSPFGSEGRDAMRFQQQWLRRAQELQPKPKKDTTLTDNTSLMADGVTLQERMIFDDVFSHRHTGRDTESALTTGCRSTLDPRRNIIRPSGMSYGTSIGGQPAHRVSTPFGERRVMPSRSFMKIGLGQEHERMAGRALDF